MDFDEQEEEEIGMAEAAGYDSLVNSSARSRAGGGGGDGVAAASTATARKSGAVRYKECLKNHAVGIGGHAVDGCGEFMAAGDEGTLDALKCAACNCHRNFHRKETEGESSHSLQHHHHQQQQQNQLQFYRAPPPAGYLHLTPPPRPLALPAASGGGGYSREEEDVSNPSSSGGGGSGLKKRFRSKFTQEQKDRMLAFAERVGWRIQNQDDVDVEQFCAETGVKRHVLKVWMHNNKHTLGKKP